MASFKDFCDLLVISYNSKLVSDKEFLVLYEEFQSKNPDFEYERYPLFDLDNISIADCYAEFRFEKNDIPLFAEPLQLPFQIRGPSASTGEHCICIVSDLLWLGLVWSCFVFCLLFLLFYVICAPVLTEGTQIRCEQRSMCDGVKGFVHVAEMNCVPLPQQRLDSTVRTPCVCSQSHNKPGD